jgi:hypothetical protein
MRSFGLLCGVVTALIIGAAIPLAAAGGGDVFGQVGVLTGNSDIGTHALVGGGASGMIGDRVAIFGELNYIPLGSAAFGDSSLSGKAILAGGGIRAFLTSGSSKVRPYIPLAVGLLRVSANDSSGNSASVNGRYFGLGIGVEASLGDKFGIRPEFRYNRLQASGQGANAYSVSAGFFYRFGGK